jgi:hypothetical protein
MKNNKDEEWRIIRNIKGKKDKYQDKDWKNTCGIHFQFVIVKKTYHLDFGKIHRNVKNPIKLFNCNQI